MKRTEYFTYRTVGADPATHCIVVPKDYDTFPMNTKLGGSYALAPARVLGLDYPTYLRFLRDSFPEVVTLEGKGSLYVIPKWKRGCRELRVFINLLNDKMMLALEGNNE